MGGIWRGGLTINGDILSSSSQNERSKDCCQKLDVRLFLYQLHEFLIPKFFKGNVIDTHNVQPFFNLTTDNPQTQAYQPLNRHDPTLSPTPFPHEPCIDDRGPKKFERIRPGGESEYRKLRVGEVGFEEEWEGTECEAERDTLETGFMV